MQQSKQIFICTISLPGAVTEYKLVNLVDIPGHVWWRGQGHDRRRRTWRRTRARSESDELYSGEPAKILCSHHTFSGCCIRRLELPSPSGSRGPRSKQRVAWTIGTEEVVATSGQTKICFRGGLARNFWQTDSEGKQTKDTSWSSRFLDGANGWFIEIRKTGGQ